MSSLESPRSPSSVSRYTDSVERVGQPAPTNGRTDELTKNSKTSRDTSLTDTCARVQDFDELEIGR